MIPQITSNFGEKKCSSCRHSAPKEEFIRKEGKEWKTCNSCSEKGSKHRKMLADDMNANLGQLMKGLKIEQPMGQDLAQLQSQQLAEQHWFEQQQSEQQQFQTQFQQRDQRMTIDYLLNDPVLHEPVSSQLHEQQQWLMNQTQQLYNVQSMQTQSIQDQFCRQNQESELSLQPFEAFPLELNMGMPPQSQLWDANSCSNFGTNGAEQVDYNFNDFRAPGDPELDFEERLANALHAELSIMNDIEQSAFGELDLDNRIGQVDSMFPMETDLKYQLLSDDCNAMTDTNTIDSNLVAAQGHILQPTAGEFEAQPQAATKRARKPKPAPFSLDKVFAYFDASQDILRQPSVPSHDLTGAALTMHLITELGMAVRLSQLRRRWSHMKQRAFLKEVELLTKLENEDSIMPWGPLSDLLTMFEIGLEDILDRYGHNKNLDWKTENKVKADVQRFARAFKTGMSQKALEIIKLNTEALLKLFIDASDYPESKVKAELNRQLRSLNEAVVKNCKDTGVLRLKMGTRGSYVQG
ncbi:hypothetical protein EKO04_006537 [Ascochyta lentis]|uniref:Uncharacterized protein n=1 Tax=Ascochyta lentis TaxID=205686 RepID=A0A8H7MHP2_9PLEO|nr:hypothetical protein EKO04_006537 [Ascochyta lentis]